MRRTRVYAGGQTEFNTQPASLAAQHPAFWR